MSIDLSLDRLCILVHHLPPYTRPTFHIAGTNGKGSVSALISSILQSSTLKVGRYNSPHLTSIYDCITIDNIPVSPGVYDAAHAEVTEKDKEKGTKLSNFEILTLTALRVFERERVDVAVVEVGMGGRLDATNIIPDEAILLSVLTAVDLDHQFFLGDTIAKIASEKAGIARKGRPFVLGFQNPTHANDVETSVKEVIDKVGAVLVPTLAVFRTDWPIPEPYSLLSSSPLQPPPPQAIQIHLPYFQRRFDARLPLYGAHQLENLGTALAAINALLTVPSCKEKLASTASVSPDDIITPESVARGVEETKWPGRLSFHTVQLPPSSLTPSKAPPPPPFLVLADGAHNPASAETLGTYITHLLSLTFASAKESPIHINITYILSLSHSPPKTPLQTLSPLFPLNIPYHATNFGTKVSKTISVVLPRFTLPEGMPWIKCVPPTEVKAVVKELIPDAEVWVVPDVNNGPEGEGAVEKALRWAAGKRREGRGHVQQANLVVLAGSLYLVADFYRFLDRLVSR